MAHAKHAWSAQVVPDKQYSLFQFHLQTFYLSSRKRNVLLGLQLICLSGCCGVTISLEEIACGLMQKI